MSRIIIQNGNMKDNIPGWPYYHVSRDGKVSKKDLILIFKLKAKGLYYKDIAKRLGVSVGTIGRVINKKSYRDENIDRKR